MTFALGSRAIQAGHRLIVHETLDSTNSEALRLARSGEGGPLWIVAREQTAGRGRRGREWVSAGGNLAASLLFVAPVPPAVAATLGFVASLAVHEVCTALAPGVSFALKWPNDVLAGGGKVAGVLLESEARGSDLAIVVGVGINLARAPEGTPFPAQSLKALGHGGTAENALTLLTDAWTGWVELWDEGRGFAGIRDAWLARAPGIGQAISVRNGDRVDTGIFDTLDEAGRLIMRKADGVKTAFSAGDVYYGDVAGGGAAT